MDGRLLLVAGLFAVVFAAGVGQSVVAGTDARFSQVVDEAVEASGADSATPAAERTEREGRSDESGAADESDAAGSASGGEADAGSSADGTGGAESAPADEQTDEASGGDAAGPPFGFEIERIEQCGRTCRDVTATLVNGRDEAASELVVETAIYAGNDTNEGDRVWKGTERVGTLAADAEHTSTRRVDLGWGGGLAVKRADGWITVETTVETANRSVTMERQREVA